MKKTPEKYANDLIEKYFRAIPSTDSGDNADIICAINCAIMDVKNTIQGFGNVWVSYCDDNNLDENVNFYKQVLTILESKL